MPDVLKQKEEKLKNKFLEELYPEKRMIAYKKCYELRIVPKKSQGYFPII